VMSFAGSAGTIRTIFSLRYRQNDDRPVEVVIGVRKRSARVACLDSTDDSRHWTECAYSPS